MTGFDWNELLPLAPELTMCAVALILVLGVAYGGARSLKVVHALGVLALLHGTVTLICGVALEAKPFGGVLEVNAFTQSMKALMLFSSALVLVLGRPWMLKQKEFAPEFIPLSLLSLLGLMLLVSARDFLVLYVSLELSSLALYVLAAIRRDNDLASEAAIKYFVLGALASCLLLFGISLVYGTSGTTSYTGVQGLMHSLQPGAASIPAEQLAFVLGLVLMLVGMLFKVSAVPFHMWTPDVYAGVPTVVTAFFANAPKIGALALLATVLLVAFGDAQGYWNMMIGCVAVASMLVGAWGAVTQRDLKRLLAYSSIGHVGYLLVALMTGNVDALNGMVLYLLLYVASTVGAFGVVLLCTRGGEPVDGVADLAGLSRQKPLLAAAFAVFLFSMAGIPPLAGFFGKYYVFLAAITQGYIAITVIGVLTSVVACFYYLRIIKVMYFDEVSTPLDTKLPFLSCVAVSGAALVTVGFFIYPMPLQQIASQAARALLP